MSGWHCSVCGGRCSLLDRLDLHRSCHPTDLAPAKLTTDYVLCESCGFCFAPEFREWTSNDFAQKIYNSDYIRFDPGYLDYRPRANASSLERNFGQFKHQLRHLDYGGGNGLTSGLLSQAGWNSTNFDPYDTQGHARDLPESDFNLITAYEVFEHVVDVHKLMQTLAKLLAPDGVVLFSTMLSDAHIEPGKPLSWWYAAPRNGHISLFSEKSLHLLASANGLVLHSFSEGMHALWRKKPTWISTLTQWSSAAASASNFNRTTPTHMGPMLCNRFKLGMESSLLAYGEFVRPELQVIEQISANGHTVVDVGAGVGIHSIFLSGKVGKTGVVHAFETERLRFQALCANLATNQCANVIAEPHRLGGSREPWNVDNIHLNRCDLLVIHTAIDVESVIEGAQSVIAKFRPTIYFNNSNRASSEAILSILAAMDYRCWWHVVPWFNPANFNTNPVNIFGPRSHINVFCQPRESTRTVLGKVEIQRPDDWWE